MKFIEGMLVGSMVTVGVTMFCTDWISKSDTKKMMKKGKQFDQKTAKQKHQARRPD